MTPKEAATAVEKLLKDAGYQMDELQFSEPVGDFIGRHSFNSRCGEIAGHSEAVMTEGTQREIRAMVQAGIQQGNDALRRHIKVHG